MRQIAARTDLFSPFISTLDDDVAAALRAVLGVPTAVAIRWYADAQRIVATLDGVDGASLSVELHTPAGRARWSRSDGVRDVGLSYQLAKDGSDPWHDDSRRPFLVAMAKCFEACSKATLSGVWTAWRRRQVFAGLHDWMFRQINGSGHDVVGNLRLGFRCNQDCGFCWQGRQWPEPDPALYMQWLDQMSEMGVRSIAITGGEPTLHPKLPELIERAERTHNIEVTLQTNAVQLAKPRTLQLLANAGLQRLFVSLHAMDATLSDAMTRAPGTFVRTIAGIEAALDAELEVHLNCLVETVNVAHLPRFAEQVVEQFVTGRDRPIAAVTFSEPCTSHDDAHFAARSAPYDSVRPALIAALQTLNDGGVRTFALSTCGFTPCILATDSALMRVQLDATPAPEATDETDRAGRTYLPPCDDCSIRQQCLGVRNEYAAIHGSRGLLPVAF